MTWRDAFRDQAESCAALGSPFTARVLTLLADRGLPPGPVMSRIAAWPGNITSRGRRIYHMPWGRWYRRTKIETARGERWFCSEAEAIRAGWQASRN